MEKRGGCLGLQREGRRGKREGNEEEELRAKTLATIPLRPLRSLSRPPATSGSDGASHVSSSFSVDSSAAGSALLAYWAPKGLFG